MRTRDKQVILKRFMAGETVEQLATRRVPEIVVHCYPDKYHEAVNEVEGVIREACELLKAVHDHYEAGPPSPDAPGHGHTVQGKWDRDGSPCEWCATWNRVRKLKTGLLKGR